MKNFDKELADLVKIFAEFKDNAYQSKADASLQKVEAHAIALFTEYLTQDGLQEESIKKQYKVLSLWFHPDKLISTTPERKWLNDALSTPETQGGAFKLIGHVYEQLLKPKNVAQEKKSFNLSNMDELLKQLKTEKSKATTRTQIALLQSIIDLLESAEGYHSSISSEKKALWIQGIFHSLPYISGGVCVGFYVKELALFYASIYLISAGGQWLESSSEKRWQMLGRQMQSFSATLHNAVLALLAGMASLNYMALHHARYISVGLGGALYRYLVPAIEEKPKVNVVPEKTGAKNSQSASIPLLASSADYDNALILSPQHLLGGKEFTSLETKLIALPLEQYQVAQGEQYFSTWRLGNKKGEKLAAAVTHLQALDVKPATNEKFQIISDYLSGIASHKLFNDKSSNSFRALQTAINLAKQLALEPSPLAVTPSLMIEHQPKTEEADEQNSLGLNTLFLT